MFFSTIDTLFFPSVERLNFLYAYRPGMFVVETASATIAPGHKPSNRDTPVDINDFRVAHAHEGAIRKTVKQMGVSISVRAARRQKESACPSHPRRTAAKIRDFLACLWI